ncbi:MAG: (2Fe-2S)-binding protein [Candidatus Bathyarchaeota archaeon]|nr:(2Fe-2S)-binding protein [Candidatus Bathyarchaeota archaeon]
MSKLKQGKVSRRGFVKGAVAGLIVGAAATYGATQIAMPGKPVAPAVEPTDGEMVSYTLNGNPVILWVNSRWTLAHIIRNEFAMKGTSLGCNLGECGSCTVLMNGIAVPSCMVLAIDADGATIETVEGLASGGELHPIQKAFIKNRGFQCGFCTPGFMMATKGLLDKNPNPTEDEMRDALSGNICRCTGYVRIMESAMEAAEAA